MATSSASLDRSPKKNWVEKAGGLPPYVRKIARAIHEKRGIPLSEAISYAIGRLKKWAAGGDGVSAATQAKAAAAIAAWEKLKAKSKLTEAVAMPDTLDENLGVPSGLLLQWVDDLDARDQEVLVEAAAGKGARMPPRSVTGTATGGRTRAAAAMGARDSDFESKHPRGGKGSPTGGKFVAKGSSGTEVRAVQRRVGARVDGEFGNLTEQAVRRFQQQHGLKVDGIIGRQTVAALRGRKDAKRVKVGALSDADRSFLTGHVRGKGRRRRGATSTSASTKTVTTSRTPGGRTKTTTTLVEAVAPPAFLERVKGLELGEVARLPDGGAVKHHAAEDGRKLWTYGHPSRYADDGVGWGDHRRTAEEAVADALTRSAGSTDPASLGGQTRFGTYSRVTVNGKAGEFVGVTAEGRPRVRYGVGAQAVEVSWPEVSPVSRLIEV